MQKNVNKCDRMARFILAIILVILYGTNVVSGTLGVVALVVAAVMVITASMSFCPLYKIIGIKPCCKADSNGKKCCGGHDHNHDEEKTEDKAE